MSGATYEASSVTSSSTRQQLLELAHSLDRIGKQAEQFLAGQLDQLAKEIEEFEHEKAAWRRQYRRESTELSTQRDEIERLRKLAGSSPMPEDSVARKRASIEETVRKSGIAPLRLLVVPSQATSQQLGVFLCELTRFNKDLGGRGLRFELSGAYRPRKRLLGRATDPEMASTLLEFHVFPAVPLKARGAHVQLEDDNTDRVEEWISWKIRVLQAGVTKEDLDREMRRMQPHDRNRQIQEYAREAARRPESELCSLEETFTAAGMSSGSFVLPDSHTDFVRKQILRLQGVAERLFDDFNMRIQICP
ncbi:MAG: hypothetical protein KDA91_13520 [Planctomycetaceae bacterium]|nr:hypothetical protein [Planctomycetaceae bacterium]